MSVLKNICSAAGHCVYTFPNGTVQIFSLFKTTPTINNILIAIGIYFFTTFLFLAPCTFYGFYLKHVGEVSDESDESDELDESDESEWSDDEDGEELYESRYFKDLEAMPDKELTAEELKNLADQVLAEETPKGVVCMSYNIETGTFEYYTDHFANITYEILDTVARLFTFTFDCKQICVNYRAELEKGEKHMLSEVDFDRKEQERAKAKENECKENECKEKERSVFATFKTYNKKNGTNLAKKYYVITENANRFKFKGKLDDYKQMEKNKTAKAENTSCSNISYSDYKQILQQQQQQEANKKMD